MTAPVVAERRGRLLVLTVERPPLNILDLDTIARLNEHLDEASGDAALQLLVVRGAGDRAFSAGAAVQDHTVERVPAMLGALHHAVRRLRRLEAVSIAAVRGHCLGGGMELAAACDLVLASEGSRFGQPEIELGCFPPVAAALYPGRVGTARSLELLLSGRTIDCAEAEALGFVTWRVPDAEFEERLESVCESLLARSGAVSRLLKRAVQAGRDLPFADALAECERLYLEELTATEDMNEGIAAFLDKRRPTWRHR